MTIPLSKLNCLYCTKLVNGKCTMNVAGLLRVGPSEFYCIQIFKDFREERGEKHADQGNIRN